MTFDSLAAELRRYGPGAATGPSPTPDEARAYCRQMTRTRYENFTVASWLLPAELRQHFCNIYAYCRWADDLADETHDRELSLKLLDWWQDELTECYRGRARHPVFVALGETIRQFAIPPETLADLLVAFRQDQWKVRYATFDELLAYCRYSANPVGRLVLYLGRCHQQEAACLSDSICTGLQLANFCQDVARDYERGRIYLPVEDWKRFGYDESMFERRLVNDEFRRMMAFEVDRGEAFLQAGWPLWDRVPAELRVDMELYIRGGLAVLEGIRRQGFDVWSKRPSLTKMTKFRLLTLAWSRNQWRRLRGRGG